MSTRKLIITALVCGLAIMVAGGVKLFQVVTDTTEVIVNPLGVQDTLSDMTVTVVAVDQLDTMTAVTVAMKGVDDGDPVEGWRVLNAGEVLFPVLEQSGTCRATEVEQEHRCVVEFPPTEGSVTVAYVRAGTQSQWAP